jgi:hypothetical protein
MFYMINLEKVIYLNVYLKLYLVEYSQVEPNR